MLAWVGSVLIIIAIGIIALAGGASASGTPQRPSMLSGAIDVIIGAFLFIAGVMRVVEKPKTEPEESKPRIKSASLKPQLLKHAALGILLTVTNFTSLASYLASAKLTVDSGLDKIQQITAMSVAGFYFSLPILWPLLFRVVAPSSSEKTLTAINQAIKKHGRYVIAAIALLFGAYLAVKGLRILV